MTIERQKQRVGISQAIVLDEATAFLDTSAEKQLKKTLKKLIPDK